MKLALAWLAALCLGVAMAGSCSINHKSSDFECETQADCADFAGRTCSNGFCVQTGTPVDAGRDTGPTPDSRDGGPIDGAVCPDGCTSCNQERHECNIDCAVENCNQPIACPEGWACNIGCTTANSCRAGISCVDATACTIVCSGAQACRDLDCGEGQCKVACTGVGSCRDMSCGDSCACDLTCNQGAACTNTECPLGCNGANGRCSSTALPTCNSCQ